MAQSQPLPPLSRLKAHLEQLESDPSSPADSKLFDECLIIPLSMLPNDKPELVDLVSRLARISTSLQQDPSLLIQLLQKFVQPFSFSEILRLDPPVDFVVGLDVAAQPFNLLLLDLLAKAADNPSDAAHVAGMPGVIRALVYLWLVTEDVGIAGRAAATLLRLLKVDLPGLALDPDIVAATTGQGLVWRRLFGDRDVYGLLYSICGLQGHSDQSLSKRVKTVAQSRLMEVVPQLGRMSWNHLTTSHHADIEQVYGLNGRDQGLLDFVCAHMVDTGDDVLMHMNVLQFFTELISVVRQAAGDLPPDHTTQTHDTSVSLAFLRKNGHHAHAISYFLDPNNSSHDPLDVQFLHGPSANYASAYASQYPAALLSSHNDDLRKILTRLSQSLDLRASVWANPNNSPKHDLSVLASLPRVTLLLQSWLGTGSDSSPLLFVPCKHTNADALATLATVFRGPDRVDYEPIDEYDEMTIRLSTTDYDAETAATRAVYLFYAYHHAGFLSDILGHADIATLPEKAFAACEVISSIIEAQFAPLPGNADTTSTEPTSLNPAQPPTSLRALPTETQLPTLLHLPPGTTLPPTTPLADLNGILASPIRETLLPWLLRPRDPGSSISARHGMDSLQYKLYARQWEIFLSFHKKLTALEKDRVEREDRGEVLPAGWVPLTEVTDVLAAAELKLRREDPSVWRPEARAEVATLGA